MNQNNGRPNRYFNWVPAKTRAMLKDNSGAALMMAIFAMTMLLAISMDMLFETSVEVQVSSQAINQVKAYYAAKAGVDISLLRIHIYKKASAMVGSALPVKGMLDPIWQMPFTWPPLVPPGASGVDKDDIKKSVKESLMTSQYLATIESESSKIDINDLGSPSAALSASIHSQLLQIFNDKIKDDEKFASHYAGFDFNKVLNNIADWVDADHTSRNGGDESALYSTRPNAQYLPPNMPFKTLGELHEVSGMDDEIFKLLQPRITIYGAKGININYADKEVLKSLSPLVTDELAEKIIAARQDPNRGPFKDLNDFEAYIKTIGINDEIPKNADNNTDASADAKLVLIFDSEFNFRIKSQGTAGKVTKEITAIVYDTDKIKDRLALVSATPTPPPKGPQNPDEPPKPAATPTPTPAPSSSPDTVKPNIVYWNET